MGRDDRKWLSDGYSYSDAPASKPSTGTEKKTQVRGYGNWLEVCSHNAEPEGSRHSHEELPSNRVLVATGAVLAAVGVLICWAFANVGYVDPESPRPRFVENSSPSKKPTPENSQSDYELLTSIGDGRRREIFRELEEALDAAEVECKANGLWSAREGAYERYDLQAAENLESQMEAVDNKHVMAVCNRHGITYMQAVQIKIQAAIER